MLAPAKVVLTSETTLPEPETTLADVSKVVFIAAKVVLMPAKVVLTSETTLAGVSTTLETLGKVVFRTYQHQPGDEAPRKGTPGRGPAAFA